MKLAFGYLRVSGSSQLDGDGFERQHFAIAQFAASRGYDSITYFREEAVAGKSEIKDRPAFLEMVTAAMTQGVQTIIVERLDRLAREFRVQELILTYLACHSIDLMAGDTGENVTEAFRGDPMRRAMIQIQGIFAELEKNMIVNKLLKARQRARDRGERCEGQPPYGYRTVKANNAPVSLERVDEEQEIIACVRGMRESGVSVSKIAYKLNDLGKMPRRGLRWYPMQIKRILARTQNQTSVTP